MLRVGTIGYLHLFNIEDNLSKLKRITPSRIVEITKENKVQGGDEEHQYMEYECISLLNEKVYTFNNYWCNFKFTSIQEIKDILSKFKSEGYEYAEEIEKDIDNILKEHND